MSFQNIPDRAFLNTSVVNFILGYGEQIPFIETENTHVELLASGALDILPDLEDRSLVCDAIVYRCDCFCTRDWKTILKHRDELKGLPIEIVTPTEW
jgi:hypothetical protein